tara:strand:+ start:910 stop:1155 length:246 start_codon:yes stop_codon:yes gene_type:complete
LITKSFLHLLLTCLNLYFNFQCNGQINIAVSSYHENIDPLLSSDDISEFKPVLVAFIVADSAIEYAETKIKNITKITKTIG